MLESVLLMFSSRSFIVSGPTFGSLIHFGVIFVYGVRKCSSFILFQVVEQFSQHHLLKRLSFFYCIFLPPLPKIRWPQVCGFIAGLSIFSPLFYTSVFVLVPYCLDDCSFVAQSEVRQVDSSSSILLSQDCFGYLRFFFVCLHKNCEILCSSSVKNTIGSLIRIALNLQIALGIYSFSLY